MFPRRYAYIRALTTRGIQPHRILSEIDKRLDQAGVTGEQRVVARSYALRNAIAVAFNIDRNDLDRILNAEEVQ